MAAQVQVRRERSQETGQLDGVIWQALAGGCTSSCTVCETLPENSRGVGSLRCLKGSSGGRRQRTEGTEGTKRALLVNGGGGFGWGACVVHCWLSTVEGRPLFQEGMKRPCCGFPVRARGETGDAGHASRLQKMGLTGCSQAAEDTEDGSDPVSEPVTGRHGRGRR